MVIFMFVLKMLNVKFLVIYRFFLEKVVEVFEIVKKGVGLKVMIKCDFND